MPVHPPPSASASVYTLPTAAAGLVGNPYAPFVEHQVPVHPADPAPAVSAAVVTLRTGAPVVARQSKCQLCSWSGVNTPEIVKSHFQVRESFDFWSVKVLLSGQ